MGILNATPDSFFSKGIDSDTDGLLRNAARMIGEGATILDIGGASTKPGEPIIDPAEELRRILPAIQQIRHRFSGIWLSVDTYHARVAAEAVAAGVDIVNDVSSGDIDDTMIDTVARLGVPYIAMHMQGTPETMQKDPRYTDVVAEVKQYLQSKYERCRTAGIRDVIIDPGFGFGKTVAHNFALLHHLHEFTGIGSALLAGVSRKSMVCKPLHVDSEQALNGTTALHMTALMNGAQIIRVHDVKEAAQVITLYRHLTGELPTL